MKIVVIGYKGQLGSDLMRVLKGEDVIGLAHQDIEITDYEQSLEVLEKCKPGIIINTAAYNQVDAAEDEPGFGLAFAVNALGPRNLALISKELGARLVHISTDYVFDGQGKSFPYFEWDCPKPLSVYGTSKLAGEHLVQIALRGSADYSIIRTAGLYGQAGSRSKGGNFVESMLELAQIQNEVRVVDDQILTPTYTLDLAQKIVELIQVDKKDENLFYDVYRGICHITNSGCCSWYEFAKKIFELAGLEIKVIPISSKEFGARAKRPKYSVLSYVYLRILGLKPMRPWQEALKAYLEETGRIT